MAVFDKILEFFGMKSKDEFILPDVPRAQSEVPTNRGTLEPRGGQALSSPPRATPAESSGVDRHVQEELERANRERELAERKLRESEAARERLAREQAALRDSPESDRSPTPSATFESVTGQERGSAQSARPESPPADDKTRNPLTARRPVEDAPTGVLIGIAGPNTGLVRALRPGSNIIGRHTPGAKLAVPLRDEEQIVSREHCEIESTNDRFTITPLTTSNGELAATSVNGSALERKTILKDGATLKVFDDILVFRTVEGGS